MYFEIAQEANLEPKKLKKQTQNQRKKVKTVKKKEGRQNSTLQKRNRANFLRKTSIKEKGP